MTETYRLWSRRAAVTYEPPTRRSTVRTPSDRVKGAFGVADAMAYGHP